MTNEKRVQMKVKLANQIEEDERNLRGYSLLEQFESDKLTDQIDLATNLQFNTIRNRRLNKHLNGDVTWESSYFSEDRQRRASLTTAPQMSYEPISPASPKTFKDSDFLTDEPMSA